MKSAFYRQSGGKSQPSYTNQQARKQALVKKAQSKKQTQAPGLFGDPLMIKAIARLSNWGKRQRQITQFKAQQQQHFAKEKQVYEKQQRRAVHELTALKKQLAKASERNRQLQLENTELFAQKNKLVAETVTLQRRVTSREQQIASLREKPMALGTAELPTNYRWLAHYQGQRIWLTGLLIRRSVSTQKTQRLLFKYITDAKGNAVADHLWVTAPQLTVAQQQTISTRDKLLECAFIADVAQYHYKTDWKNSYLNTGVRNVALLNTFAIETYMVILQVDTATARNYVLSFATAVPQWLTFKQARQLLASNDYEQFLLYPDDLAGMEPRLRGLVVPKQEGFYRINAFE